MPASSISFPYATEKVERGFVFRPKIPITLSSSEKSLETLSLVDSGSDVTVVPLGIAEFLGIDTSGKVSSVSDFHEKKVEMAYSFVNLKIEKGDSVFHIMQMPARIPLKEEDQPDGVILGRDGIFREFDITFEENARRIVLQKIRR